MKKSLFIADGKLSGVSMIGLYLAGIGIIYLSVEYLPLTWLKILGLTVGIGLIALAGYSGRAHALGLPGPFARDPLGWRKAKSSYANSVDGDESPRPSTTEGGKPH